MQSARRNNRLSARYVPSRYHEPRFTNVVHCYVLEKYRRSTLLAARTRARPPLVTYVVDVVLTAVEASYAERQPVFLKIPRKLPRPTINGRPSRRDTLFTIFSPLSSSSSINRLFSSTISTSVLFN